MFQCPVCSTGITEDLESCPSCGEKFSPSLLPTVLQNVPRPLSYSSAASVDGARFVPGTLLAERYRIIGLLGRGGMGEVFRAEDLKLGQQVALKFLPASFSRDAVALERFHREVRLARQISHPNVCRVFDIGEVDGHHFISMEYIDGEDLASLLRRIGHLPATKAAEIARQLCAGLAEAHENQVLHRDLKPANVMLDGRGKVRITDFGLAHHSTEAHQEPTMGTPAYMAPEQLAGKEATIRSDIYSLGLVLYEIFTGKRVFEAKTLPELLQQRQTATPTSPSLLVKDLDPLVEKIILRCLEPDPEMRPTSALQVAAALPGGDPLAAALAAGETPSPEMVAAAPKEGALAPWIASVCFGGVIALLFGLMIFAAKTALHRSVPLIKSPEVLAERVRSIVQKLGYSKQPVSSAYAFGFDRDYLLTTRKQAGEEHWKKVSTGQPLTFYFWYRQSPHVLIPDNEIFVTETNPPPTGSGMIHVVLDPRGRLVKFQAVPQKTPSDLQSRRQLDWPFLFTEAGLDLSRFEPAEPLRIPPVYADQRISWRGAYSDHPDIPVTIEAASLQGQPVYFEIVPPWEQKERVTEEITTRDRIGFAILITAAVAGLIGAALLARRNLKLGRGDRKGAYRVTILVFWCILTGMLLKADHIASLFYEIKVMLRCLNEALLYSALLWLLYIALEPYVRRIWPKLIISWSRLLAGGFRDPLVGRDILIGGLLGLVHTLSIHLGTFLSRSRNVSIDVMTAGLRSQMADFLSDKFPGAIITGMFILLIVLLLYVVLRTERRAIGGLFLLYLIIEVLLFSLTASYFVAIVLIALSVVVTIARFGLLAMMSHHLYFGLTFFRPITSDFSIWYAESTLFALFILVGLAAYGFYTSLAGQPLFRSSILQS